MTWLASTVDLDISADFGTFGIVQPWVHLISETRLVVVFRSELGDVAQIMAWGGALDPDTGGVVMDDVTTIFPIADCFSDEQIIGVWALPGGGYYVETFESSGG